MESSCVSRQPPNLYQLDHRRCLEASTRTFYCDFCWKPFEYCGDEMPYWGGFTKKTWNLQGINETGGKVTRADLYQGWNDGIYDLSWHCVPCHAEFIGCADHQKVAYDLGAFRLAPKRRAWKEQRFSGGKIIKPLEQINRKLSQGNATTRQKIKDTAERYRKKGCKRNHAKQQHFSDSPT